MGRSASYRVVAATFVTGALAFLKPDFVALSPGSPRSGLSFYVNVTETGS
jgi:hypothetical protein